MRLSACALAFVLLAGCVHDPDGGGNAITTEFLSLGDEMGFRRLRQDFHLANMNGDYDLLHSLWADDAVLTTRGGKVVVGADAIADYFASSPNFGRLLVLTAESSWWVVMRGSIAEFGFESILVDVGGEDPWSTAVSVQGGQNPAVEIVEHAHGTGIAVRVAEGRWIFKELNTGSGPLSPAPESEEPAGGGGLLFLAQRGPAEPGLTLGDEVGFRRMREDFHLANITGDRDLMRTVWADDAVFTTGAGVSYFGAEAIVDFFAGNPNFGRLLVLTPESSQRIVMDGDVAEYAFECISLDVGGGDPMSTAVSSDGSQNPVVEFVTHTNSTGFAVRVAEGRWVFREFNGGRGPLPPAPEGLDE